MPETLQFQDHYGQHSSHTKPAQVVAAWQQNFNQVIPINLFSQGRLAQQHNGIKQILDLH